MVKSKEFSYINKDGHTERVVTGDFGTSGPSVEIYAEDGWGAGNCENVAVFVDDIPKLIVALQAAYDFSKGETA